jgi:hypothetical protein
MMQRSQFTLVDGGSPKVPGLGALGERYHYWCGHSGRRYLFSAVTAGELLDFTAAVVVLARRNGTAIVGEEAMVLDGEGRKQLEARLAADPGIAAFIHLLSPTDAARRAAIEDLLGIAAQRLAA